ncbi:MAG: tRNA (N6-isopentenyl adenosine(37)-C2)-methylthiotransferase MiaB [Pseudomonadota bacterium]
MQKKIYVKTYGCQMNVYDSAKMAEIMQPLGYETTDLADDADLVILNTCHIREKAENKVYSDLGRIRKLRKQREEDGKSKMLIAVGGCVGQAEGEEIIRRAPYVDMVFGSQSYHDLPDMVTKALRGEKPVNLDFSPIPKFDMLLEQSESNNKATKSQFISIQEGCDKFCTFCVVPYTRGAEISRNVADILTEAKNLVRRGVAEINLLGQNVNAYHGTAADGSTWSLARLLYTLAEMDGLERIIYTTSHPKDMNDELIRAHGEIDKLMPYLHLPIQSGSDNILAKMNRKHKADLYLGIIDKLRTARPDIAFSSDFIVGFPGESDADFNATLRLIETVGYSQAYSFSYSPRPGTPAADIAEQIPEDVKAARLQELQALLMKQQKQFNEQSLGKTMKVLFDRTGKKDGQLLGKSPQMQSVYVDAGKEYADKIVDVTITGAYQNSLSGQIN